VREELKGWQWSTPAKSTLAILATKAAIRAAQQ
jgi:CRISPR/Cas system-associated exonuclease Cas4 (RecB family)